MDGWNSRAGLCRPLFMFYCRFYFTCDHSLTKTQCHTNRETDRQTDTAKHTESNNYVSVNLSICCWTLTCSVSTFFICCLSFNTRLSKSLNWDINVCSSSASTSQRSRKFSASFSEHSFFFTDAESVQNTQSSRCISNKTSVYFYYRYLLSSFKLFSASSHGLVNWATQDYYIRQVNGVKLADIMFSLLCVCVCVCAQMADQANSIKSLNVYCPLPPPLPLTSPLHLISSQHPPPLHPPLPFATPITLNSSLILSLLPSPSFLP